MVKDKRPIIFTHLPKTAGNTLHRIIERQYLLKRGAIFSSGNIVKIKEFISLPPAFRKKIILVRGHLYYGVHNYLYQPARYFAVFRDPVKRALSHYNFLFIGPKNPLRPMMLEHQYTLDQLFENGKVINLDNCQVRFLCGVPDLPFGGVTEEHLQIALDNLVNHYEVIGLSERFDESILLFAKAFGWSKPWYTNQNVNEKSRVKFSDLSEETLAKLKYYNRFDEILYKKAQELFEKQLAAAGPSFEQEVAQFKEENKKRVIRTKITIRLFKYLGRLRFYTGGQKG